MNRIFVANINTTHMKTLFRKIMGSSFLVGMASVFCPSILNIEPIDSGSDNDLQNIANDWRQVGSYITQAYESCTTEE